MPLQRPHGWRQPTRFSDDPWFYVAVVAFPFGCLVWAACGVALGWTLRDVLESSKRRESTMDNMSRSELVRAVARLTLKPEREAKAAVDAVLDQIVATVRGGGEVRIGDFGTFKRVRMAARKARHPATGESMDLPARNAMRFKPARTVAERMG